MAVETATERAIFFDADDFGVAASYTRQGQSAVTINGIFDNEFFEVEAGGEVRRDVGASPCRYYACAGAKHGDGRY